MKAGYPSAKVVINEDKPRKGCFEVTVNGEVTLSLLDMPRPNVTTKIAKCSARLEYSGVRRA